MFWKRIALGEHERALVAKNGRFHAMLMPGLHRVFTLPGMRVEVERFDIRKLVFHSAWTNYLMRERMDIVARNFIVVETSNVQVAMLYADGKLFRVLAPAKRMLLWRGSANITAEVVDVVADSEIEADSSTSGFDELIDSLIELECPVRVR